MQTTASTALVKVLVDRRTKLGISIPTLLPWGGSVYGMTVAGFAREYQSHLSLVVAERGIFQLEPKLRLVCGELSSDSRHWGELSSQGLTVLVLRLTLESLRRDMESERIKKQQIAQAKRQQKSVIRSKMENQHSDEGEDETISASLARDPDVVFVAVCLLLSLVGRLRGKNGKSHCGAHGGS